MVRDNQMRAAMMRAVGELAPRDVSDERHDFRQGMKRNSRAFGPPGAPQYVTGSLTVTRATRVSSAAEVFQREVSSKRGRHKVTKTGGEALRRPVYRLAP